MLILMDASYFFGHSGALAKSRPAVEPFVFPDPDQALKVERYTVYECGKCGQTIRFFSALATASLLELTCSFS